jgi:Tol biopolymer transport system component
VRRTTSVLFLIVVLASVAPATSSAQSSAWAAGNGLLAFRSDRDGEPDVFSLDPSTSTATKLTKGAGAAELQPAFSPEGGRIAFVRRPNLTGRPDLFVMTAQGKDRTRITSTPVPERDPSWSPNGTHLLYAARTSPSGPFRIFLAQADGSGRVQLTTQLGGDADRSPAFSPDGAKIAFVSDRDGGFSELYLMNADGTGLVRLTTNAFIDGNPAWTPDGTRLVFERCCENGTSDLVTIDMATSLETDVTSTPDRQEFDPVVSPDGTRVAFAAFDVGVGNIDIWVVNLDGSSALRLTQDAAPDLSPDWQPLPACTIRGSGGIDDLRGTDGADVICSLGGDDLVRAGFGDDLVLGGKGNDVLEGQDGEDVVLGEGGGDMLRGGANYDVLDGGGGTDTCVRGADGALRRQCEF